MGYSKGIWSRFEIWDYSWNLLLNYSSKCDYCINKESIIYLIYDTQSIVITKFDKIFVILFNFDTCECKS